MSIAQRYAEALLSATGAREESQPSVGGQDESVGVADELDAAAGLLVREADLKAFFGHPGVGVEVKREVLREVFAPHVRRVTLHFLQLLLDKRRLNRIEDIARAFRARVEELHGRGEARVLSARPLARDELDAIAAVLERRTGKKVSLAADVRPELIGGVRVVMGDKVLDGTVRGQLERLSTELAGRN